SAGPLTVVGTLTNNATITALGGGPSLSDQATLVNNGTLELSGAGSIAVLGQATLTGSSPINLNGGSIVGAGVSPRLTIAADQTLSGWGTVGGLALTTQGVINAGSAGKILSTGTVRFDGSGVLTSSVLGGIAISGDL